FDAEIAKRRHGRLSLEKQAREPVACSEEYEDHECHDQRHGADHREHRRALVVHFWALSLRGSAPVPTLLPESSPATSPTRSTEPVARTAASRSAAHARASSSARNAFGSHSASS